MSWAAVLAAPVEHLAPLRVDAASSRVSGLRVLHVVVAGAPRYGPAAVGGEVAGSGGDVVVVTAPTELVGWWPQVEDASGYQAVLGSVDTFLEVATDGMAAGPDGGSPARPVDERAAATGPDALVAVTGCPPGPVVPPARAPELLQTRIDAWRERGTPALLRAEVEPGGAPVLVAVDAVDPETGPASEVRLVAAPPGVDRTDALRAGVEVAGRHGAAAGRARLVVPVGADDPEGYAALIDLGARPVLSTVTMHLLRPDVVAARAGGAP